MADLTDLTPAEAADILRVSRNTMYRLLRSGKLPSYRLPSDIGDGQFRIRRTDLDRFRGAK